MKKVSSAVNFAQLLATTSHGELEATVKAQLIDAVLREVSRKRLTHAKIAARAGLPRSAVTGILSGSLQKVTINRVLRLVKAVGLEAEVKIRRAA